MRGGVEAAGDGDLDDGQRRVLQQRLCPLQAQMQVVAPGRELEVLAEHALELALRDAGGAAEVGGAGEVLQARLHELDDAREAGMGDALADARLHALAVLRIANAGGDELLGYGRGAPGARRR